MDGLEAKLSAVLSDPEAMARFRQLASALSGSMGGTGDMGNPGDLFGSAAATTGSLSPPLPMDSGLTELLGKVLRAYSASSEAMQLVAALKPWLRPERAERLEKAMRVAHLARAARAVLPELLPGNG